MIRIVKKDNYEFVSDAVEGSPLLGNLNIDLSWFVNLYKNYKKIKGADLIYTLSIISFSLSIVSTVMLIVSVIVYDL
jgi:hypothetical protein